jgi:hypothetical protein
MPSLDELLQELRELPATPGNKERRRELSEQAYQADPDAFTDLDARSAEELVRMTKAARTVGDEREVGRLEVFTRLRYKGRRITGSTQ